MISDARGGHVSPGIYTEERDVTYSVKSLGITSLGLVGETLYGPAFENIEIENWSEFVDYFGGTSTEKFKGTGLPKYELPFIAKSYLEESKRLNVVRVLGLSGYNAGPMWTITSDSKPVVVLRSKMEYGKPADFCEPAADMPTPQVTSITIGEYKENTYNSVCVSQESISKVISDAKYFSITVSFNEKEKETTVAKTYTYNVTLDPTHTNYIYNVISNKPDGTTPIYIEAIFEASFNEEKGIDKKELEANDDFSDYREPYRAAQTPWVVSDASVNEANGKITKSVRKLFKFITISDGNAANHQIKVSIQNIKPEDGTFDVVVRDFFDTDANPIILERFSKCNLVEGSTGYIAYKIGSNDGGFVTKSKYILVQMADSEDLSNSIPAGFIGYPMPFEGVSMNYNKSFNPYVRSKKQYFGFSNIIGIESDIFTYKGVEAYEDGNDSKPEKITAGFHMDSLVNGEVIVDGVEGYVFESVDSAVTNDTSSNSMYIPRLINAPKYVDDSLYKDINTRKFTVCFYGGFDGWDVNRTERTNTDEYKSTRYNISASTVFERFVDKTVLNLPLNLPSTAITSDYYAYLAGYRVFANPQDIDINLFATPGIDWYNNTLLTEEVIEMIEDSDEGRGGDALYIMTSPSDLDPMDASEMFDSAEINSSYACTYSPWVLYHDSSNKRYINLPVTKDVVRNMAATDNNSYPWFAPAGIERGNVNCVKANYKTTLAEEDMLYENGINPVKTFAQDGVKIWGNKTAYNVDSPLNRINVRRLMIRVKKLITSAAKNLIFTQYDDTIEKQFRSLVEPILADVKANKGISDYRLIVEVTPEAKDQHILPAKILIKPTPALEYISISFVVYPESVSFENE